MIDHMDLVFDSQLERLEVGQLHNSADTAVQMMVKLMEVLMEVLMVVLMVAPMVKLLVELWVELWVVLWEVQQVKLKELAVDIAILTKKKRNKTRFIIKLLHFLDKFIKIVLLTCGVVVGIENDD